MILVIAGSRCQGVSSAKQMSIMDQISNYLHEFDPEEWTVITGGASGVDTWAFNVAREQGFPAFRINAEWNDYQGNFNKRAGFERNSCLVEIADQIGIFWDKLSRGTRDTMNKAMEKDIIIDVIYI